MVNVVGNKIQRELVVGYMIVSKHGENGDCIIDNIPLSIGRFSQEYLDLNHELNQRIYDVDEHLISTLPVKDTCYKVLGEIDGDWYVLGYEYGSFESLEYWENIRQEMMRDFVGVCFRKLDELYDE